MSDEQHDFVPFNSIAQIAQGAISADLECSLACFRPSNDAWSNRIRPELEEVGFLRMGPACRTADFILPTGCIQRVSVRYDDCSVLEAFRRWQRRG
jgi:hypothetical protein